MDKQIFLYGYMDMFILYYRKSLNVDKIIIDFVRENHCIDKRDVNFKNVSKKRDLWQKIFTFEKLL